jgi:hypothetical protein
MSLKAIILCLALSLAGCGDNLAPTKPLPACANNLSYGYCGTADGTGFQKDAAGNFIGSADGTDDANAAYTPFTPDQAAAFQACTIVNDGFGNTVDVLATTCPR